MFRQIARKPKKDEAADNAGLFFSDGTDLDSRVIHLTDTIEPLSVDATICGLQLLVAKSKEPIKLYINSFGGDPYSAFALYDYIRSLHDVKVNTYAIGACMSAASIIFLAGDERYMYKNSVLMLHTVSSMADGKLQELIEEGEECKRIFHQMLDIYEKNSNLTKKEWGKKLRYQNVYIRVEEASKMGLITGVVE